MVFSDHQLLSGVQLCNESLAKLRPALPIGALIFPVTVSCSNLLSLSRGFRQVSVVGLDAVVVESEIEVLEIF